MQKTSHLMCLIAFCFLVCNQCFVSALFAPSYIVAWRATEIVVQAVLNESETENDTLVSSSIMYMDHMHNPQHSAGKESPLGIVVSDAPLIIHGDGGGDSVWSQYKEVIIGVCVSVGALAILVILVIILIGIWLKIGKTLLKRTSTNDDDFEQLLLNGEEATYIADPPAADVERDKGSPNKPRLRLRLPADNQDIDMPVSISTKTGGLRFSLDGEFAILVPPNASHTSTTITAAACSHTAGYALPSGVIPLSTPVELHPDSFVYDKEVCVVFQVRDDICFPHGYELSLWHKSDDSLHCTEVCDSVCRLISPATGHCWYIACWTKYHCSIVPCMRISDQRWKLIAEVYAELLDGAISNLHVFVADSSQAVQEAIGLYCTAIELVPIAVMVNGVDRERMVFELASGFSHLSVNMEAFENVALSREVKFCHCQTGPQNVHHVVFFGSTIPHCVLRISTCCIDATCPPAGESCIQTNHLLQCEASVDLSQFPHADPSRLEVPGTGTHCETWCQPLTESEHSGSTCPQTRTLQLRAQGTPLTSSMATEIRDWFNRIGLTVRMLLLLAQNLDLRLEQHLQRTEGILATDESEVATIEQVGKLVTCYEYITDQPCVEEIIGSFLGILTQGSVFRVGYDQPPECNEGIRCQFEELITRVLTYESDANLYDPPSQSAEIELVTTGPRPPNDFSRFRTRHLQPLAASGLVPRGFPRHSFNSPPNIPLVHQNDLSSFGALKHDSPLVSGIKDHVSFSFSSPPNIPLDCYVVWAVSPGMSNPLPSINEDGSIAKTYNESEEEDSIHQDSDHSCRRNPDTGDNYRQSFIGDSVDHDQSDQNADAQLPSIDAPPHFKSDGQVDSIHPDTDDSRRESFAGDSGSGDHYQSASTQLLSIDSPPHFNSDGQVDNLHPQSNAEVFRVDSVDRSQSVAVRLPSMDNPSHFNADDVNQVE